VDHLDVALDERTCVELLDLETLGRAAFVAGAGPQVVPVAYVRRGEALHLRAPGASELARLAPGTRVALEIDQVDRDLVRGWTVLAVGPLLGPLPEADGSTPDPVAGRGDRDVVDLRVAWDSLTGRWIGPVRRTLRVQVDGQIDGRGAVRLPVAALS
jgi:hypothetical protein